MKRLLFAVCAIVVLTSCSKIYYQIYSVASEEAQYTSNGSPIFKTDDGLEFTYNFWGEYGNLRFIVYNNNDYDVIIDMTRSAFIRNNIAEDYFTDKEIENRVSTGVFTSSKYGVLASINKGIGTGTLNNYLGRTYDVALTLGVSNAEEIVVVGQTVKKEWQTATIRKEPKSVRVPAKSAKVIYSFDINNCLITSPSLRAQNDYRPITFTKDNSPLIMQNRICVYKEDEEPTYHNMDFYINEIGNVCELSFMEPTSFYVSYSSRLEQDIYFNIDMLSILNNMANNSPTTGRAKSPGTTEYNGLETTAIGVNNNQTILLATNSVKGTWDEAIEYCNQLGSEWRLPSEEELQIVRMALTDYDYWTVEEVNEQRAEYYSKRYNRCFSAKKSAKFHIQPVAVVNASELEK